MVGALVFSVQVLCFECHVLRPLLSSGLAKDHFGYLCKRQLLFWLSAAVIVAHNRSEKASHSVSSIVVVVLLIMVW